MSYLRRSAYPHLTGTEYTYLVQVSCKSHIQWFDALRPVSFRIFGNEHQQQVGQTMYNTKRHVQRRYHKCWHTSSQALYPLYKICCTFWLMHQVLFFVSLISKMLLVNVVCTRSKWRFGTYVPSTPCRRASVWNWQSRNTRRRCIQRCLCNRC